VTRREPGKNPKPCRKCGCPPSRAQYTESDLRRGHWLCRRCSSAEAHARYLRQHSAGPRPMSEDAAERARVREKFAAHGVPLDCGL
jgi:hypothetical protein